MGASHLGESMVGTEVSSWSDELLRVGRTGHRLSPPYGQDR